MSKIQIAFLSWTVLMFIVSTAVSAKEQAPSAVPIFFTWIVAVVVFAFGVFVGSP